MNVRFLLAPLAIGLAATAAVLLRTPSAPDDARIARERAATPPGMVYVPGGWFLAGTDDPDADEDARPRRRDFVPSFYIDRTEVTNRQLRRFDPNHAYPAGQDDLPATAVTYDRAAAYARWAGKRLPTDTQWEKAARGEDGRRYPWGPTWNQSRVARRARTRGVAVDPELARKPTDACRVAPSRVQPVGSAPAGASPYGCLDMAGNAWEWVEGNYRGNPAQRVLRGGAVGYGERANRTYARAVEGADSTCNDTGFRCAREIDVR